ncbi:MAG TPA: ABC transporter permease [Kofleriaceae bacterium]|jgi:ABC-type transport system involved in multi-copper enzyme maturation permease subunit
MNAAFVLARITLKRLVRGRVIWIALAISMLPILYALVMRRHAGSELFGFEIAALGATCPMLVGATLGDEIEDRTLTYLWSRPIKRWAVLVGKLLAIIPLAAAFSITSWLLCSLLVGGMPPLVTILALALCAKTLALLAATISTLAPKHGLAIAISYLLFFDFPLGGMPVSLRIVSITRQVGVASSLWNGMDHALGGFIALVVIATVLWLVALWRLRKLET